MNHDVAQADVLQKLEEKERLSPLLAQKGGEGGEGGEKAFGAFVYRGGHPAFAYQGGGQEEQEEGGTQKAKKAHLSPHVAEIV